MSRRRIAVALTSLMALLAPAVARAAPPQRSTTDRLGDRRYVVAGDRAYAVGAQDGSFPALGFHTRGEMGGVWAPPLKLVDGLWFSVDGQWLPAATRFTSGSGFVRLDGPGSGGLQVRRTEVVPDGERGLLVGLTLRSATARTVTVAVDAHSELLSAYPWGETTPSQLTANGQDSAAYADGALRFTEAGKGWTALVGASAQPVAHDVSGPHRGPQDPAIVCGPSGPGTPPAPPRCDDTAYGKGAGGGLRYRVDVPAGGAADLWVGVAGAESGPQEARATLRRLLGDPSAALAQKVRARAALDARTKLSLPGDPDLARGIDWSKQNLADAVQEARNLQVRVTNAGKAYPAPSGTVGRVRFSAAGFPDYPWLFATDGEYTDFAAVALGQFEVAADHLRALADVSRVANGSSGKVVHEVVTDGSVYFGANADAGNTDESAKFPTAVALVWRWSGDAGFLRELYPAARAAARWVVGQDADGDGWPEGAGNVEREGMGAEKLDNAVYTIRGLWDLGDLAEARGDHATARWARNEAAQRQARFEAAWWMPAIPGYADSLVDPGDRQLYQRYWIGATPMEAEVVRRGRWLGGLADPGHAAATLALHETSCYGTDFGLFHTGTPGCDPSPEDKGEKQIFTLNTAVMAVGEGNYGRLAQQRRFTTASRRLQLPDPDEQPGAMPEIAPSELYGRSVDKSFLERASVLQAWGSYGTAWPVVHQQLGVRPDLGTGRLDVMPQQPTRAPIAGSAIRLGSGSLDVRAWRAGAAYVTDVRTRLGHDLRLRVGRVLPAGARVGKVTLDGRRVLPIVQVTTRGVEVLVRASAIGRHRLVVRTR